MRKKIDHQETLQLITTSFVVLVISLVVSGLGWGYEGKAEAKGLELRGSVTVKGEIPWPQRFNLVLYADPYYCGRISDGKGWRIAPLPMLDKEKRLSGAIVYLEGVDRNQPEIKTETIIQTKDCEYIPYTTVVQSGQSIRFQNWDPVLHKLEVLRVSAKGAQPLLGKNLTPHPGNRKSDYLSTAQTGVHRSGEEIRYQLQDPGILLFRCKLHDFMEGWAVVLPHPYFSLTGDNGTFALSGIPPGNYNLVVWHPLGAQQTPIRVQPDQPNEIHISLTPDTVPSGSEDTTGNPFGIDLVGDARIVPSVKLQKLPLAHFDHGRAQP